MTTPNTKVLIVEDEILAAENLATKLRKYGYHIVDMVDTGDRAIVSARESQPDIVLMDIMLKGHMDGICAANHIYDEWGIPIIYMTAFSDVKTVERAKHSSPYGYVVKPFRSTELMAVMEIALNQHHKLQHLQTLGAERADLLSVLAHDFRNPLSTIMMASEMLELKGDGWNQEERRKRIQRIKTAVDNLTHLLEDVVMLSRAEAKNFQPDAITFNILHFCGDLVKNVQMNWGDDYELRYLPLLQRSALVTLDARWLSYIINSLLSLAVKFAPLGSVIDLQLSALADHLILQVTCPVAIDDKFLARQGTNMGVSIIEKLVKAQQGEMIVDRIPYTSTTFRVRLPLPLTAQETGV
jgi:signal transduction histidine kinase